MKTKNILILSLLFLLFTDSCKKKCPEFPPFLIEQEMKDWLFFQPGSYWIYRDTITGLRDCVYVTKSSVEFIDLENYLTEYEHREKNPCPPRDTEELTLYMSSYLTSKEYYIRGQYPSNSGVQNNTNPVDAIATIVNLNHSGSEGGRSHYMFFPVLQGTVGQWAYSWTFIRHDTIYTEYEVYGKKYENVLRVHDNYNAVYYTDTKFYHAKNIGVIKKEIYIIDQKNPQSELLHVWELVRYEVIQ